MSDPVPDWPKPHLRAKKVDVFLLLLLFASLSLNVYLGWRVKQSTPNFLPLVAPGTKVGPITASDLDGNPQTISYQDTHKATVLYVLSPDCIWCDRNRNNIAKLIERGDRFRFVGLSLTDTGLHEYVAKHQPKFPIYTGLTQETVKSLGLGTTPQTIVISPEGRVLKNWTGAYTNQQQVEIEEYFETRLPGVTSK